MRCVAGFVQHTLQEGWGLQEGDVWLLFQKRLTGVASVALLWLRQN